MSRFYGSLCICYAFNVFKFLFSTLCTSLSFIIIIIIIISSSSSSSVLLTITGGSSSDRVWCDSTHDGPVRSRSDRHRSDPRVPERSHRLPVHGQRGEVSPDGPYRHHSPSVRYRLLHRHCHLQRRRRRRTETRISAEMTAES